MKDIMTFSSKMLKNSNIQIKQGFKHMDKFQVDSNHHHHNHPHLKDHLCGEAHHVHVVNKPEVFDYKQLLTGNLNLNTIVNEGGNLFFDCLHSVMTQFRLGPRIILQSKIKITSRSLMSKDPSAKKYHQNHQDWRGMKKEN